MVPEGKVKPVLAMGMALLLAFAAGCDRDGTAEGDATAVNSAFQAEHRAWRDQRQAELLRPDGWTSLVGLHWLELKAHHIGSGERIGNTMRLAFGPERMGLVTRDNDGSYWFTPEQGVELTYNGEPLKGRVRLYSDRDGVQSVIGFDEDKGKLTLVQRGDRHALRVRHSEAPTRVQFAGLQYWPADPSWRIEGRFIAHPPGKTLPIADIVGTQNNSPNPGVVEFVRDGRTFRLEALADGDGLFFVLADRTSGHGSYPAGRFLDAAGPDPSGRVVLDFNRAYNPPCAFTLFATCPLPPPENRLDLAITAGEKNYVGKVH